MSETVITPAGLSRLSDELRRLTTVGRERAAQRLRQAIASEANPTENADYLAAREEQALLEQRIARLQDQLGCAQLVEPQPGNGLVDVGERVRVRDLDTGRRLDLELVGPLEADVSAGRITLASPLGRAIVGRRRGDVVDVDGPRGKLRYRILAVS